MEISKTVQGGQVTFDNSKVSDNSANSVTNSSVTVDTNTSQSSNTESGVKEKPVDDKELRKAVDKLNNFFQDDNVKIEYAVHPQFKDVMIKIIDKDTGNVITEVPPKKILDMVAKMCELAGMIFDKKA